MKRISFFLALTLIIFSFGLANAEQSLRLIEVSGFWHDGDSTYINAGTPSVVWDLRVVNTNGTGCGYLFATPFELKSDNGATWGSFEMDTLNIASQTGGRNWVPQLFSEVWLWGIWPNTTPANGTSPDTVAYLFYWGGTGLPKDILYDGFDATGIRMWTGQVPAGDTNKTMCLISLGANAATGWEGTWAPFDQQNCSAVTPAYLNNTTGDPYPAAGACYTIKKQPDVPPVISGDFNPSVSHCVQLDKSYTAVDPDGSDAITFSLGTAPAGANITTTGHLTWQPTLADVNTSVVIHIIATESDGTFTDQPVNVTVTNAAPTIADGCGAVVIAQTNSETVKVFKHADNCPGDPHTFFIVDDAGAVGTYDFYGDTLKYTADDLDVGDHIWTVGVTDGYDTSTCTFTMKVSAGAPYGVKIEKTEKTPQGQFVNVDVSMIAQAQDIGGFNFLMAYDASALTFQGADVNESPLYGADPDCAWEYFTYRFGPDGNCGTGCPSGIVRVVGIAETNNGPVHPGCWSADLPYVMFSLNFLVSNDRTLECSYVPIRFFWIECGDNTISNKDGSELYISATVKDFDYEFTGYTDIGPATSFPSYQGALDSCATSTEKAEVFQYVDFYNGGVDIVCGKDVDDRGDVNLDGLPYTIADAVMFTNYFIYGLNALVYVAPPGMGYAGSIAATDINADGIALSVADLVYLIRIIVGDAQPYATGFLKPATVNAVYHINNGVVSVDEPMGAAVLHIAGDVTPVLLADNMESKWAYNEEKNVTSVVVYSLKNNNFVGDFIDARGDVIDIEMATAKGNPVNGTMVPSNFALLQNYPNPFNPTTNISFNLAAASDYTLTIYNLVGQVVTTFNGHSEAGTVNIEWDASNNASGVYFYKLDAGTFSATKKMVLLK